eukprot:CAMPEP_0185856616 /NCGR_PEP_ID=MMETSP1354-20130828/29088_1 /TAXON_ID=708628 /ORGANISM="Erythrolobus madagascarensis, Strain CCMP3276" /LENGTH=1013 /DNA_ID=CAMNT_0028558877 /DNA_START=198 /DNA_END=3239 /DNA_ORIENTATION=+
MRVTDERGGESVCTWHRRWWSTTRSAQVLLLFVICFALAVRLVNATTTANGEEGNSVSNARSDGHLHTRERAARVPTAPNGRVLEPWPTSASRRRASLESDTEEHGAAVSQGAQLMASVKTAFASVSIALDEFVISRRAFATLWPRAAGTSKGSTTRRLSRASMRNNLNSGDSAFHAFATGSDDGDDLQHVVIKLSRSLSSKQRSKLCRSLFLKCTRLYSIHGIDVIASKKQLSALESHPMVSFIASPRSNHKLASDLLALTSTTTSTARAAAAAASERQENSNANTVALIATLKRLIDPRATPANAVIAKWRKHPSRKNSDDGECDGIEGPPDALLESARRDYSQGVIRVEVESEGVVDAVKWLACRKDVIHVKKATPMVVLNKYAIPFGQAGDEVREASTLNTPLWTNGVVGEGQKVHVADTGIDYDNCFFRDTNSLSENVEVDDDETCYDSKRKVKCYFSTANFRDDDGHGTHVAGTAAGLHASVASKSIEEILAAGLENGHAPKAEIVFTDMGESSGALSVPADLGDDFLGEPYDAGARVSSHSWGCFSSDDPTLCNIYDVSARSVDEFMWNNMDALMVFAAGNSGLVPGGSTQGMFSVGSPGTSKNQISVGAAQTSRSTFLSCSGDLTCSPQNLAGFSSRGPTRDRRYKPDLVFPGEKILSAANSGDPTDGFFDGESCDPASIRNINELSGTSMATPAISGIATLVRDYFARFNARTGLPLASGEKNSAANDGRGPTGALVKCVLVHSARLPLGFFAYIEGLFIRTDSIADAMDPKAIAGRGIVSALGTNTLLLPSADANGTTEGGRVLFVYDRYQLDDTGSSIVIELKTQVPTSSSSIKVTMLYTDAPGPIVDDDDDSVLVNDLDLRVQCIGDQCSSSLTDARSQSRIDNVEQIYDADDYGEAQVYADGVDPSSELTIRITISAHEIEEGPQPFSMVISGQNLMESSVPADNFTPVWTANSIRSGGSGLSTGAIIGIAVGGALLLILVVVMIYVVFIRGAFKNEDEQ